MRARGGFTIRVLRQALHVLRTEGPIKLLGKVKRRLRTTPVRVPRPTLQEVGPPYPPLVMPAAADPRVTVVIPVHNQYHFTYQCLASILRTGAEVSAAWVVVDDCSSDGTAAGLAWFGNLIVVANLRTLGFVGSCNRGAGVATGEYIVFLNNDIQVQPGWLDALVGVLDADQNVGLVGSRLLYPDGRQQEAGAIIFRDGTAWKYGHLADPGRPQYSYVRDADYVSGAALAIRRTLFEEIGGFDEAFAPGYYEDVDLAFRVRAAGFRVCYQPASWVVHFEGVTAGLDEHAATGMKRFQAEHRSTFRARWHDEIVSYGRPDSDVEREKERAARRRVLVVDIYMLTPDRESGSLRMLNFIAILQSLGCKVTFAATNLESPEPYLSALQQRGVEVLYRPYIRSVAQHLRTCGARYDLVILSRLQTGVRLLGAAQRYCRRARIVYDTVDLHFLREQRLAELNDDAKIRAWAARREREELGVIAEVDTTLVVSSVEKTLMRKKLPNADVRIVSNIHELHGSARSFDERSQMLFIGSFAHPPNTDAVLWFCSEIFPHALAAVPELRLLIVGADPPPDVQALADDRVSVLGHVPDVAPLFDRCRLSVAPIRYGAGVKGKINQSLAYGLPVVATSVAAEGMFLKNGESVLLAETALEFAGAVVRLYRNRELWDLLSRNGLKVMEQHFSFRAARRALSELVGLDDV